MDGFDLFWTLELNRFVATSEHFTDETKDFNRLKILKYSREAKIDTLYFV